MAHGVRVQRPPPHADRPRPATLAASAVTGLVVGLALAYAAAPNLKPQAERPAGPGSNAPNAPPRAGRAAPPDAAPGPTPRAVSPPAEAEAPTADEPTLPTRGTAPTPTAAHGRADATKAITPPSSSPTPENARAADAPAPTHEGVAPAPSPRSTSDSRPPGAVFEPGVVAYLHCQGIERKHGPFPCPRDVAMEKRVWRALRGLEHCREATPGFGGAQVRLEFRRGSFFGSEIRTGSSGLAPEAVKKCAVEDLSRLRTKLKAVQLIVSFRFQLARIDAREANSK